MPKWTQETPCGPCSFAERPKALAKGVTVCKQRMKGEEKMASISMPLPLRACQRNESLAETELN